MLPPDDHDYRSCEDEDCERFGCRVYKEGWRNGYDRGYPDGETDGYGQGYGDGYSAGAASAG